MNIDAFEPAEYNEQFENEREKRLAFFSISYYCIPIAMPIRYAFDDVRMRNWRDNYYGEHVLLARESAAARLAFLEHTIRSTMPKSCYIIYDFIT